jgi:hypothetical protein
MKISNKTQPFGTFLKTFACRLGSGVSLGAVLYG